MKDKSPCLWEFIFIMFIQCWKREVTQREKGETEGGKELRLNCGIQSFFKRNSIRNSGWGFEIPKSRSHRKGSSPLGSLQREVLSSLASCCFPTSLQDPGACRRQYNPLPLLFLMFSKTWGKEYYMQFHNFPVIKKQEASAPLMVVANSGFVVA